MSVTADLSRFVYSYLVIADSHGRPVGDLASAVPSLANGGISRDGRTYVYHLRRNVIWQHGVPFTGRDVVASWRAVMNPRNNTFDREAYETVTSIVVADPVTVVVHLRKRYPPFVSRKALQRRAGAHRDDAYECRNPSNLTFGQARRLHRTQELVRERVGFPGLVRAGVWKDQTLVAKRTAEKDGDRATNPT